MKNSKKIKEEKKMADMKKINVDALDNVTGGRADVVHNSHKGYDYANCRKEPRHDAEVLFTIPNGTEVTPTGNVINNEGVDWYEIKLSPPYEYGWVAGNLIGH